MKADSNQKMLVFLVCSLSTANCATRRLLLARNLSTSFPKDRPQTGKKEGVKRGVLACKKQKRMQEQRRSSVCTFEIDKEQRNITLGR
jgi:hypothetical protein